MASQDISIPLQTPSSPRSIPASSTAVPSEGTVRLLKRQREPESVSPRSRAHHQLLNPLASPSKIARLSLATNGTTAPLTGAAALEDERRLRIEERTSNSPSTSPNPSHNALASLMSGATQAMSRPSDAPPMAPTASMEPAAKAASALSLAAENGSAPTDDREPTSPQSTTSAVPARVVESPAPMEVDSGKSEQPPPAHHVASQDDRPQPGSLSYPGSLQVAANLAESSARGMSYPMPGHVQSSPTSSTGKKHKCPYCNTEFTRHHNLKSHLLTHSQEKPYVCTDCQMRFRRLHDLKRHGKLHTGEKPHICPKCDRKFARGDALARHSKGAGGCAGRRASMGSFADGDEMDGTLGEGEDSTMSGIAYDNPDDEELRRQSLPSIGAHASGDNYGAQSRTYPPAGSRSAAGPIYPPSVNQSQAGTTGSSSVPNSMASSHTANTSVSSVPTGSGGGGMYSQANMTESPKPLSPGLPGQEGINTARPRSPNLSQPFPQQQAGRRTSDLQSPHGGQPRPKLPGLSHSGFAAPTSSGYPQARTTGAAQAGGDSGNMFAQSDPSVWAYIQTLEDKVKSLSDKVVSLDHEMASLKKQLDGRDGNPTA